MLLKDKVVLVTGASQGIGKAIAIGCAQHGADVGINFARDEAGAADTVAQIEALGRKAFSQKADVSLPESATDFIQQAVDKLGRVDVFVNNAGICPFHAFLDMPVETLERTMKVNLHGAYFMVQAAANQMVKQGNGGSIIAVSSISALVGGGMQTHYTPTKAGVHSLMQSCAIALGPYGIRCNSLLPGTIETAMAISIHMARRSTSTRRARDASVTTRDFSRASWSRSFVNVSTIVRAMAATRSDSSRRPRSARR